MNARAKYTPLTEEERVFASEHHYLINKYLGMKKLNVDEWYDVVVFRYLLSVQNWFKRPELHSLKFSTIAFKAMWSAIGNEYANRKRRIQADSLDVEIPGTDGLCLADTITSENLNYIYTGGDQMNVSYNVSLPERKNPRAKSDETIAIEAFLGMKMENMCFEYDTADEAKKKFQCVQYNRRKNEQQKVYEAFRDVNKVYIVRLKGGKK